MNTCTRSGIRWAKKPKAIDGGIGLLCLALAGVALADDMEPRRWTPLPIGTNVVGAGAVYTEGDIAFDPVLKVEDATVEVETVAVSYLRAFDFFGRSARVDFLVPHQHATWKGLLDGQSRTVGRIGPADPRIRFSVSLAGAPALPPDAFRQYRASHPVQTVVGAALALTLPLGEYQKDKVLNLGQNRFVIEPQLGVLHSRGPWSCELTGSLLFFTDNNEFRVDKKREQDPLFALQSHVTYTAARGWWLSLGAAYDWGGESMVEGVRMRDLKRDLVFGTSAGMPLGRSASIKIAYVGIRSKETIGADTDSLGLALSIRF